MSPFITVKFTGIEHNNCAPEHTRTVRKGSEVSLQKQSTLEITNTFDQDLVLFFELFSKSKMTTPFVFRDQFGTAVISFKVLLPAKHVTNIPLTTQYTKPSQEKDASCRNRSTLFFSVFLAGSEQAVASAQLPLKLLHASAKMRRVMFETLNLSSAGLSFTSSTERSPVNSTSNVLVAQNLLDAQVPAFASVATEAFGFSPMDNSSTASTASSSPSGQEHGQSVGLVFLEGGAPESPASPSSSSGLFSTQEEASQMMLDNLELANPLAGPEAQAFSTSSSSSSSSALPHVSLYYFFQGGNSNGEVEEEENDFFPPPPLAGFDSDSFFLATPFP